ncbi:MAG: peptidylprolyl isomerase [Flavobacteriaceae bacterium]|nr:peptidylprolyl isomerase [Flavobacteriaceae bacterium]
MMRILLIIIVLVNFYASCSNPDKTAKETKATQQQTPTAKKAKRAPTFTKEKNNEETINRKNTIEFLNAFGKENQENKVVFKTRLGDITVRLYDNTPLHRASFIFLAKQGYFNTVAVHRIVEDFVVQGGNSENPLTRRMRKKFDSYNLPAEFRSNRKHKYGALAAARNWENNPNKRSTPFEFYFVVNKQGAFHLDGEHTVYGEVIRGFEVLDKMNVEPVDQQEWPKNDIFFKVEVLN